MKSYSIGFRDFAVRVFPTLYIVDKTGNVKEKITKHDQGYYNVKLSDKDRIITCLKEHKDKLIIPTFLKPNPYPNEVIIENGIEDKYCSNIKKYNNIWGQTNQTNQTNSSDNTEINIGNLEDPYQLDLDPHDTKPPQSNTDTSNTGNNTTNNAGSSNTGNNTKPKTMKFQILDAKTRQPLMGAEVYNTVSKTGAITDANGYVRIDANDEDLIQIRYMGYKPIDVKAKNIDRVVLMTPETEQLDTVTVTIPKKTKKWLWIIGGLLAAKYLFGGSNKGMAGPEEPDEDDIPVIEI